MNQTQTKKWLSIEYVAFVFSGPYFGSPVALSPDFKLVMDRQEARPFRHRQIAEEYLSAAQHKLKALSPDYHWQIEENINH